MTHTPVIYLSAVTPDLDSIRHKVTDLLTQRGCRVVRPSWTPDGRTRFEDLSRLIGTADLVLQIIGYQTTPFVEGTPPEREMTYLHTLEQIIAVEQHKPVHPIFLTEEYPTPLVEGESEPELSERHRYWREFMRSDHLLYIPASEAELLGHVQRLHVGPFPTLAATASR